MRIEAGNSTIRISYCTCNDTLTMKAKGLHYFSNLFDKVLHMWGPLMVAQLLRYCATNRKVAGSIPDGVIGIFHSHNPFDRSMALGSTQPLAEMSTRSISWG
jgi:hypothetical protein